MELYTVSKVYIYIDLATEVLHFHKSLPSAFGYPSVCQLATNSPLTG
jgi:hypothetical protein